MPVTGASETPPVDSPRRSRRWIGTALRALVLVAIALSVWLVFRDVPWDDVGDALATVSPGEALVLLALALLNVVVVTIPLRVLMGEISQLQATRNDLGAHLIANFVPPPGDTGLRLAMLRSWNLSLESGLAALMLNVVLFYISRFTAPLLGFTLILLTRRFEEAFLPIALIGGLIGVAIVVVLILIARAERSAAWVGRTAGRIAGRFREVDPQSWEAAGVSFRTRVHDRLTHAWGRATLAYVASLAMGSFLVVAAMRFAGVPSDAVAGTDIAGAYLLTYPLNMLPFNGIVVLDGLMLETLAARGGADVQGEITAGLMLWRVATLVLPFLLGLLVLLHWQAREGRDISWRSTRTHRTPRDVTDGDS